MLHAPFSIFTSSSSSASNYQRHRLRAAENSFLYPKAFAWKFWIFVSDLNGKNVSFCQLIDAHISVFIHLNSIYVYLHRALFSHQFAVSVSMISNTNNCSPQIQPHYSINIQHVPRKQSERRLKYVKMFNQSNCASFSIVRSVWQCGRFH